MTERVISQLLTEMDGLESMKDIIVLAATNRPDLIDRALLRTGRFDRFVYVRAPDTKSRKEIFDIYTDKMPLDSDVSIGALVDQTEGYVGGDIEAVCREAGMRALREDLDAKVVSWRHFESALAIIHASVTPEDIERFEKIEREMRRSTQTIETTPPHYV